MRTRDDEQDPSVIYQVIDLEYGDVLAQYDSFDEAKRRLVDFVEEHPGREDELGVGSIDDTGRAVELVTASELHVAH